MQSIDDLPRLHVARERVRRHGIGAALHAYGMRAFNRAVSFKILRLLYLSQPNPVFRRCPDGYSAGFATREALHRFARQAGTDLSPSFIDQALARGDQCFAICDGDSVAAYGWHAFRPTPTHMRSLMLHFDRQWVYRYKDFTAPRYRGRRLHAFTMTLALEHYLARGFNGLVAYVDSINFDSLRSCRRAGYRPFGSIFVLQGFDPPVAVSTPGCARLGLSVEPYSLSPFGTP